MPETPATTDVALPSSRTLLRSTAIAAAVAALLLLTVVLPAEYGVDPTGVGNLLGLKQMGEIKVRLAREAAAEPAGTADVAAAPTAPGIAGEGASPSPAAPASGPAAQSVASRTDETRITLAPGQGREIKLAMKRGAVVRYRWATDKAVVNYDMHADRKAAPAISYHGYAKGQGVPADSGVLVAAFDGMHGWFWRNRTRAPLAVVLNTSGNYDGLEEVK